MSYANFDHAGRLEVESGGPRQLRLSFWPREATGRLYERHPNIAEAVEAFRAYIPNGHPVQYKAAPEPPAPARPSPLDQFE